MSQFLVDIFSPSEVVVKDLPADSILIPTQKGEINVLKGHTHIVEKISTGMMTVKNANNQDRHFLLTAGVCKVLNNKITILSYVAEKLEDIDLERAKSALQKAQEALYKTDELTDLDLIKQQRKKERAELRMKMAYLRSE